MRRAFQIQIQTPAGEGAYWKELGWKDAFKLPELFNAIEEDKFEEFIRADKNKRFDDGALGLKRTAEYHQQARDVFALRNFPPINQTIPVVTALGIPDLIRLGQKPYAAREGLLGYHFAVLRDPDSQRILGFSTLERTNTPREVEISAFMHPKAAHEAVYAGLVGFMSWAKQSAGYQHFLAHTQARTKSQPGNQRALHAAIYLGFRVAGKRAANDHNGNGHETLILKAPNWSPPKKYATPKV